MSQALRPTLAAGRRFELTLMEQLGNIGSEAGRATRAKAHNSESPALRDGGPPEPVALWVLESGRAHCPDAHAPSCAPVHLGDELQELRGGHVHLGVDGERHED
jgi:hypothetical protein